MTTDKDLLEKYEKRFDEYGVHLNQDNINGKFLMSTATTAGICRDLAAVIRIIRRNIP